MDERLSAHNGTLPYTTAASLNFLRFWNKILGFVTNCKQFYLYFSNTAKYKQSYFQLLQINPRLSNW